MTRFLLDEMLSGAVAQQLRDRGHDCFGIVEQSHLAGMADAEVLELARGQGRLVVTLNVGDFVALDREWRSRERLHHGIVLVSTRTFPQNRGFLGAVVTALDGAAARGSLPGIGAVTFLAADPVRRTPHPAPSGETSGSNRAV